MKNKTIGTIVAGIALGLMWYWYGWHLVAVTLVFMWGFVLVDDEL